MKSFVLSALAGLGCVVLITYHTQTSSTLTDTGGESVAVEVTPETATIDSSSSGAVPEEIKGPPTGGFALSTLASLNAEADPNRRSEAIARVAEAVSKSEMPGLLNTLMASDSPAAREMCQLLARRWAEQDAPAAAAWVAQLSGHPFESEGLQQVAIAWGEKDMAAAVSWVNAMTEGPAKEKVAISLGYEASRKEPLTALELASRLPPTPQRDALLNHAVSQWASSDWNAAAQWASSVPDINLREQMLEVVAVAAAERDGAAAAGLVASALQGGPGQERAAVAVSQRWGQKSPRDVAAWIAAFPEGSAKSSALENLFALWAEQDNEAATAWWSEQGNGVEGVGTHESEPSLERPEGVN